MTANQQQPNAVNPDYTEFMVLEGSDGTIYQIPLADLEKYKITGEDANKISVATSTPLACRMRCSN